LPVDGAQLQGRAMRSHDNWDRSRGLHGGVDRWNKMGDDYIDIKPDELFSELLGAIASPLGIAELDRYVLAFRIPKCMQSSPKGIGKRMSGRPGHQHSNTRQFSQLLRPRRERPSRCCAPNSVMNSRRLTR
jgi:hypothetical protein